MEIIVHVFINADALLKDLQPLGQDYVPVSVKDVGMIINQTPCFKFT